MPKKLDQCVKAVMASGKPEDRAYAICQAQMQDSYRGTFNDSAVYDPKDKTAVSVRDGILEYLGVELGMEPPDRIFRVYRSPATIANAAMNMPGIAITDEHVPLDMAPPGGGGFVSEAEMIDATDSTTETTIAIRNRLTISDTLAASVDAGKRELSLGYNAELVPHDVYDFEQRDIIPHHLAVVDRGRCGSMCSFIDRKPQEAPEMAHKQKPAPGATPLHAAFCDEEGAMNLQQIVELATALPEAIKSVPVDQLQELLPALQQIVEASKGVLPAEEPEPAPEPTPGDEEIEDEEPAPTPEEEEKAFSDKAAAAGFVDQAALDAAIKDHAATIEKARSFLPDDYSFADKSTAQIMRDALATDSSDTFADSELPLAFKMLKAPSSDYRKFGDAQAGSLSTLADKEL